MGSSVRIQKKIYVYSYLFRLLGVLSEDEFNRIKKRIY